MPPENQTQEKDPFELMPSSSGSQQTASEGNDPFELMPSGSFGAGNDPFELMPSQQQQHQPTERELEHNRMIDELSRGASEMIFGANVGGGEQIPASETRNRLTPGKIEEMSSSPAERVFGESPGFGIQPTKFNLSTDNVIPQEQIGQQQTSALSTEPLPSEVSDRDKAFTNLLTDTEEFAGAVGSEFVPGIDREISEDNSVAPFLQGVIRGWADFGAGVADVVTPGFEKEDALDSDIGVKLFGDEEQTTGSLGNVLMGQEIAGIFGDVERGDEATPLQKLGYGALGFSIGSLDAFGGGGPSKAARYTLDLADDAIDTVIGGARGSMDELIGMTDKDEVARTLRELAGEGVSDDAIDTVAERLAKANNLDDFTKELDRFEGYTRARNDVRTIAEAAEEDVDALVNAKNADEVQEVLSRDTNNLNRLFSGENASDVRSSLARAKSGDEVVQALTKGAQDSLANRGFVTRMREGAPQIKRVGGQRIIRSTDQLYKEARAAVKEDLDGAVSYVKNNSDDKAVARAFALIDEFNDVADNAKTAKEADQAYEKAADVANEIAEKLTEQGRSLQAASVWSRQSPQQMLKSVQKQINEYNQNVRVLSKTKELTTDETRKILSDAREIQRMEPGIEQARKFQELNQYINTLTPDTWLERLGVIFRSNLLTSLATSIFNLSSTTGNVIAETISSVPRSFIDTLIGNVTGEGKKFAVSGFKTEDIVEGYNKGWDYLKTGFSERNIAQKFDKRNISFGQGKVGKVFQAYTDGVFRLMGAQDQVFYYGALGKSMRSQAKARAINKGLKGKERDDFIQRLVDEPTEEMVRYSTSDALDAVFQNKTAPGQFLNWIRRGTRGTKAQGLEQFIIPFATTPSAAAVQIYNYTPLRLAQELLKIPGVATKELVQQAVAGRLSVGDIGETLVRFLADNQFEMSKQIGRSLTGTGVMAMGVGLYEKGNIQLGYPSDDQREAELAQAEGRSFNSIRIGDNWYPAETLGPLGGILLMGATYKKNLNESGSPSEAMTKTFFESYDIIKESSPFPSIFDAVDVMQDPERYGKEYLGRTVSGFIPNFVQGVAATLDGQGRTVTSDGGGYLRQIGEEITEQVKKGVPFLREQLQPKLDVLGNVEDVNAVNENLLRRNKSTETDVTREFRRLKDQGFEVFPTRIGGRGYESLSDAENVNLVSLIGTAINQQMKNVVNKPEYQQLPDNKKAEQIEDMVRQIKNEGRAFIALQKAQDIESFEEYQKTFQEMFEDNAMTQSVYEMYLQLGGSQIEERFAPQQ